MQFHRTLGPVVTRSIRMFAAGCLAAALTAAASASNIIHVPADHATIQAAIDAAENGDEIIVAPGTYHEAINFLGKAITVKSSGGAQVTTIDAQPLAPPTVSVVTFASGEGRDSVIDGFTVRGGTGTPNASPLDSHAGGGIRIRESSPIVRNCIITQNMANFGAGISATDGSDPLIESCHITLNHGNGQVSWGGAVAIGVNSTGHLLDTVIEFNTAFVGGGLLTYGNISLGGTLIENCQFLMNSGSNGGAANVNGNGLGIFKNCSFINNPGLSVFVLGVGTSNPGGTAEFENCHFTAPASGTVAVSTGGPVSIVGSTFVNIGRGIEGAFVFNSQPYAVTIEDSHFENITGGVISNTHAAGSLTITDSTFLNNQFSSSSTGSAGINAAGTTTIKGCTFIGNTTASNLGGGAIWTSTTGTTLHIEDSLFVENSAPSGSGGALLTSQPTQIMNSTFDGNSALSNGGAISLGGTGIESSITGCTFENNSTTATGASGGGAIRKFSSGSLTISDTVLTGNSSSGGGGALRHQGGTLTVMNSTISGNSAAAGGAALRTDFAGKLLFQSTLFCENSPDNIDGEWTDLGGNAFHDECPDCAFADLDCDGSVGVSDLLILLAAWGKCADCTPNQCPADLDGDCAVGVADLLLLLANWG